MANFIRMTVCFAVNHACVVAVLGLAVGLLGDNGSFQSGSLYLTYAITALFFSTGLIDCMGPRMSLIVSASLYSVYVISFPVALVLPKDAPAAEITVALFGGVVGGFAAG